MQDVSLHLVDERWCRHTADATREVALKGQVFCDGKPIETTALGALLATAQTPDALKATLPQLNGFYAWVERSPERIRAAVDPIRSRPLFYATPGDQFYLSDDAEWVRQQVGDREMDPVAREEFQLAGYVTGAETLFPNVKQLQAGECLVATREDGGLRVETHRYFRFLHTEPADVDEPALRESLDRVAVASIQRLIGYAAGRQIVVPLSGGYDSRLIVTLLKRLGYENILTFTYGVPGNKESAYSKRVADALGLRWHFVEYSEALWREAWATDARWTYQKWASGWTSIAHVQDWLAVKIMKEQGVMEPDCLFVPGHSGDFVAGSHIPDQAKPGVSATLADLTNAAFAKHYSLAPLPLASKRDQAFWAARILDRADQPTVTDGPSFADAFEKWDWQERQAKFICNSVRVYEFFGYDWWMPLWDAEFMRFWEGVPLELRKGRHWYLEYVQEQFSSQSNEAEPRNLANATEASSGLRKMRQFLEDRRLMPLARKLRRNTSFLKLGQQVPLQKQSHFLLSGADAGVVADLESSGYSVIGAYAQLSVSSFAEYLHPKNSLDYTERK